MARRRLNPDDVLAARGYNAQVLWPRYEPGGGVNSGSEPPVRPSNTLQSNQSNLVLTRYNPADTAMYDYRDSRGRGRHLSRRQAHASNYDDFIELRPVTGDTSSYYHLTRNPSEDEMLLQHLAEMEREEAERGKEPVEKAKPKQLVPYVTASGQLRHMTQKQYDLMRPHMKKTRSNPKREIGDSMQARRKSKSCSGAQINPGDSITKTEAGWERTDLL